jgi:nucleoid-associated protein YgaU
MMPMVVGCGAFAIGAVMTFGYVQWTAQQKQLQLMTQMVETLQQPGAQAASDVTTRNVPVDLLSVAPEAIAAAAAAIPAPKPVPETAPAEVIQATATATAAAPSPTDELAQSTADKIRALVSRSNDPLVSAALAQDTARRETMSVAIQGVNELMEAAVVGQYTMTAREDGGGVRLSFPNHAEAQALLENLLSSAADAGMIAFNASVKGSDGSYDGKIILFDLIERALAHGSPDERRTGEQIRQEALALLGTTNSAIAEVAPASATGERIYTVEAGDSLAYIALQFYGKTNDYLRIYEANRGKLSSPDNIQIGQKLVIPSA